MHGDWICPECSGTSWGSKVWPTWPLSIPPGVSSDCSGQFMPGIGTGKRTMGHRSCIPSFPSLLERFLLFHYLTCYSSYYYYYWYCEAVRINDRNRRGNVKSRSRHWRRCHRWKVWRIGSIVTWKLCEFCIKYFCFHGLFKFVECENETRDISQDIIIVIYIRYFFIAIGKYFRII